MYIVKRNPNNPIVAPHETHPWQSFQAFNGCPIKVGAKTHLVYRAQTRPQKVSTGGEFSMATVGHAVSTSGRAYSGHHQLIVPEHEWERYGCEDPRVTKIGSSYYIFYTALSSFPFGPSGIKAAVAISKDLKTIQSKHLVTPFNAKAMSLFPKKIKGKFTAILSANTDLPPAKIAIAQFEREEDMWDPKYWDKWYGNLDKYTLHIPHADSEQVEVGAPPIETPDGWLLVYSHISNYYSEHKVFGIRAVLLDLDDPRKVIGQTKENIMVPEESYEKFGVVPNIVFPSGALLVGDQLSIFYGGADTVVASVTLNYEHLRRALDPEIEERFMVRYAHNPIMFPNPVNEWEAGAVFNPTAIELEGKIHLLYRAMSRDNTSRVGYAATEDGFEITERLSKPIYGPREPFEEKRVMPNGNSGCEDARVTKIGDRLYLCYTAYNGVESPKVAVSSISEKEFLAKKWDAWTRPLIVSPRDADDKDACIFPDKVNNQYLFIHRINGVVCADLLPSLDFTKSHVDSCTELFGPRKGMWDSKKVGLAGTPLKTKFGYIMLYHGIGEDNYYRLGAALLDLKNPMKVLARTNAHILEPRMPYEMEGQVNKVVFPCGAVQRKGKIFIYYGGADSVTCVATVKEKDVIEMLLGE